MTATVADTARDLLDELQPPCHFADRDDCDRPAEWVGIWQIFGRLLVKEAVCDLHRVWVEKHLARCANCQRVGLTFEAVPL